MQRHRPAILLGAVAVFFCGAIAARLLAGTSSAAPGGAWQHLALTEVIGQTPKSELAATINKLGRQGWELVTVEGVVESGTTTKTVFYFKRPLQ